MDPDILVKSETLCDPVICICANKGLCDCKFFESLPDITPEIPYFPRDINIAWTPPEIRTQPVEQNLIISEIIRIGGIVKSLMQCRDAVASFLELHTWNSEGNQEYCKYLNTTMHIMMWNLKKNWEILSPHLPDTHKCYIPRVDTVYSQCKVIYHKILVAEAGEDY
jgi:hypothetical protein